MLPSITLLAGMAEWMFPLVAMEMGLNFDVFCWLLFVLWLDYFSVRGCVHGVLFFLVLFCCIIAIDTCGYRLLVYLTVLLCLLTDETM